MASHWQRPDGNATRTAMGRYRHSVDADVQLRPRAVMPFDRGKQPKPNNVNALVRECNRLAWAIHCLQNDRAKQSWVLDNMDRKLNRMRREWLEYAAAIEAMSPERFAEVEQWKRQHDDPIAALQHAQKDYA